MSNKKHIFISYAAEDEKHKLALDKHLSALKRQGIIQSFDAAKIKAHEDWNESLQRHINEADIILLLLSADALADDYIHDTQIQKALQRAENKTAIVMPILVRAVDYEGLGLDKYAVLPSNKKAITSWNNPDKAYEHIAHQIRKVAENLDDFKSGKAHVFEQILVNDTVNPAPKDDAKIKIVQNTSKNTVKDSTISAGGNVQIGDRIQTESRTSKNLRLFLFLFVPLIVILGSWLWFQYQKSQQPLQLKVLIDNKTPHTHLPNPSGTLKLIYDGTPKTKTKVHADVLFEHIPANFNNSEMRVKYEAKGFVPIDTTFAYQKTLTLPLFRNDNLAQLKGSVFEQTKNGNKKLQAVKVSILGCCDTTSNENGHFSLSIPFQHQRAEQRIELSKKGYKTKSITEPVFTSDFPNVLLEK